MDTRIDEQKESYFLELHQVTKRFGNFVALDKIHMSVKKGEFVCILGPSGC